MRKISEAAKNLIIGFEGVRLQAYKDSIGIWTIGVGATGPEIKEGLVWTFPEVLARFEADLAVFEDGVCAATLNAPLTDSQFGACVSFAFNVGLGAFKKSTLCRYIKAGKIESASHEFRKWVFAGGKHSLGLSNRREKERTFFLS